MKDFFTYAEIGERYDDYALAWDKIPAVPYQRMNYFTAQALQKDMEARLMNNKAYQLVQESAQWKENLDKEESISLNLTKFNEVMKTRKAQIEKFKALDKFNNGLVFTLNPDEILREKKDEVFAKKSQNWKKNLQRDLYLQEAVIIASQLK
jgi:carboxyl-terminal processing protease